MTACLTIIPARLGAQRLPNKPLADICGTPLIVRVWRQVMQANIGDVLVACDDQRVVEVVEAAGGMACLTDKALPSGSDRVYAALCVYDKSQRYDLVCNVQGDLPTIDQSDLRCLQAGLGAQDDVATLVAPITTKQELGKASIVKAVIAWESDMYGRALYFSRAPIPTGAKQHYHHIGVYLWRRAALEKFTQLPPSALEQAEHLEQLRALEAGQRIGVIKVARAALGVDTPRDLQIMRQFFAKESQSHAKA